MYHHYNGITKKNDFLKKTKKIDSLRQFISQKKRMVGHRTFEGNSSCTFFFFAREPEKADQKMKGGGGQNVKTGIKKMHRFVH
jgi:hypothetical protein